MRADRKSAMGETHGIPQLRTSLLHLDAIGFEVLRCTGRALVLPSRGAPGRHCGDGRGAM
jgi:hypothetical protein